MKNKIIGITGCILIGLGCIWMYYDSEGKKINNPNTQNPVEESEMKFEQIEDAKDNIVIAKLDNKRVVASSEGAFIDENISNNSIIWLQENGYYVVVGEKTLLKKSGSVIYELPRMTESSVCEITAYPDGYVLITYGENVEGKEVGETDLIRNKRLISSNIEPNQLYKDMKDITATHFWYYGTYEHPKHTVIENTFYYFDQETDTIKEFQKLDMVTTTNHHNIYLLTDGTNKYLYHTSNQRLYIIDSKIDQLEPEFNHKEEKIIQENKNNNIVVRNLETNKVGIMDVTGKMKIDFLYEQAEIKGNYIVIMKDGKYGIINNDNKTLLKAEYNGIEVYKKYILARIQNQLLILNETFEPVPNIDINIQTPYEVQNGYEKNPAFQASNIGEYLYLEQLEVNNHKRMIVGKQGVVKELSENDIGIYMSNTDLVIAQTSVKENKITLKLKTPGEKELAVIDIKEGNNVKVIKEEEKSSIYTIKIYQDDILKKVIYYDINTNKQNIVYDSKEYVNQITYNNITWNYMIKNNILKLYTEDTSSYTMVKDVIAIQPLNEEYCIVETKDHKWKTIKL